jgi:hypothetical protein
MKKGMKNRIMLNRSQRLTVLKSIDLLFSFDRQFRTLSELYPRRLNSQTIRLLDVLYELSDICAKAIPAIEYSFQIEVLDTIDCYVERLDISMPAIATVVRYNVLLFRKDINKVWELFNKVEKVMD